jgi:hypothetical protein
MTMEEQRLSEMLKRTVPEPPLELSADRVTAQHFDKSPRPWLMPALAAASVVAVVGSESVSGRRYIHPRPRRPCRPAAGQPRRPSRRLLP